MLLLILTVPWLYVFDVLYFVIFTVCTYKSDKHIFLFLFLLLPQKKEAKKSGFFADMNAPRSVHLLTAAAKVNWTLTRFRTPLYEAGHSHRFRTACRHFPRTQRHGMIQTFRFAGPDKRIAVVKRPTAYDLEEVESY